MHGEGLCCSACLSFSYTYYTCDQDAYSLCKMSVDAWCGASILKFIPSSS